MTNTKKYAVYIGIILIVITVLSLVLSKKYTVEIQRDIDAPANIIFNAINDLQTQARWNAVFLSDTSTNMTFPGNSVGNGSSCEYSGFNIKNGTIKIASSHNNDSVYIIQSPVGKNEIHHVYYVESKDSLHTVLKIKSTTETGFLSNLVKFISKWKLEKVLMKDAENLTTLINERLVQKLYNGYQIEEILPAPKFFITHRGEVAIENISQFYTQNISALYQKALNANIVVSGMPCGLYYTWDEAKQKSDMAAALPTLAQLTNIPETNAVSIPSKPALKIIYRGDKRNSGKAHNAMGDFMKDRQLFMDVPMIEEYITDPTKEPDPEKWTTNIYYYYSKK